MITDDNTGEDFREVANLDNERFQPPPDEDEEVAAEPETPAESQEDEGEAPPTEAPAIEIDGQAYTVEQVKDALANGLRQADYTRKTQELAEQRNALGDVAPIAEIWMKEPHRRAEIIHALAQSEGIAIPQVQTNPYGERPQTYSGVPQPPVPLDEMTSVEAALYEQNVQLHRQVSQMTPLLGQMQGYLQQQSQQSKINAEAVNAQRTIEAELGVKVTLDDLREAVAATGLSDPEAAWLKLNKTRLRTQRPTAAKPKTPDMGTPKTLDPKNMTIDEMERMLRASPLAPSQPPKK